MYYFPENYSFKTKIAISFPITEDDEKSEENYNIPFATLVVIKVKLNRF